MVTHGASDDDDGIGDAGETVIDCSVIRDSTVEMEVDVPLKWLVDATARTWGGSLDLTQVLPVRTHTNPIVSSGSSNIIGSIGGEGGDEGRVTGGGSGDAEQSSMVGMLSPCIIIVTSLLLLLFLNHLV